jgi:hypothetical protein
MTRAEDQLILTRAARRRWRGSVQSLPPSPFLADIECELLKHQRNDALRSKPVNGQLSLFWCRLFFRRKQAYCMQDVERKFSSGLTQGRSSAADKLKYINVLNRHR